MKTLLLEIKSSVLLTLVFALLLCVAYPLAVWAGGQFLFPAKANGSLIVDKDGTVRGSRLLAQNFSSEKYFQPRPADAVTSSGSGLDPHISVANVQLQAARVAKARGLSLPKVMELIEMHIEGRDWTVFGEPRVNVLQLDLALDEVASSR